MEPDKKDGLLIDTCIASQWFLENRLIVERVEALPPNTNLWVSEITIGEIEFGYALAAGQKQVDKTKQAEFRRWLKERFEDHRLPLSSGTGFYYGQFRSELFLRYPPPGKKQRRPEDCFDPVTSRELGIQENDLWLVSQAYNHNLVFVTADKMNRISEIVRDRVKIELWPTKEKET